MRCKPEVGVWGREVMGWSLESGRLIGTERSEGGKKVCRRRAAAAPGIAPMTTVASEQHATSRHEKKTRQRSESRSNADGSTYS